MDQQTILAVDDEGKFLEYIPKEVGHIGRGRRHLAIAVLLENSKGQVLLQKRRHQIFDNIWDLTGATHPLHKSDGTNESLEEATRRCLKEEWGVKEVEVKEIGVFNYFAEYGAYCENEHCFMMIGRYDGDINMDSNMGYEYKWINKDEFLRDIRSNPQKYTPWAIEGVKVLDYVQFT